MFIRQKKKTTQGKTYFQHQLLKSYRTSSGPRQKVILNLGQLSLPKEKWKALAEAIEDKLNNQETLSFFEKDKDIEALAGHYAQMIIRNSLNEKNISKPTSSSSYEKKSTEKNSFNANALRMSLRVCQYDVLTSTSFWESLSHISHFPDLRSEKS